MHTKGGVGQNKGLTNPDDSGYRQARDADAQVLHQGQYCQHVHESCQCHAWRGHLGLEPDVYSFVDHLVECFREVKRVLRDDGTLWLNLGQSYAGSNGNGYQQTMHKTNYTSGTEGNFDLRRNAGRKDAGFKSKDLIMVPFLAFEALRQDGWYLRSVIPWAKYGSAMPESVTDRPATAVEYVALLSKKAQYYYDPWAVRVITDDPKKLKRTNWNPGKKFMDVPDTTGRDIRNDGLDGLADRMNAGDAIGRHRRNSDWLMDSLRDMRGLLLSEQGDPMSLLVNPAGYAGAHYAVMPSGLVEPLVLASTSAKGACAECDSPYKRVIRKKKEHHERWYGDKFAEAGRHSRGEAERSYDEIIGVETLGWESTCKCATTETKPCVTLDLFGGAATTALVSDRLGRDAIACELSDTYVDIAKQRLIDDAPMFADVQLAEAVMKSPDEEAMLQQLARESTLSETFQECVEQSSEQLGLFQ